MEKDYFKEFCSFDGEFAQFMQCVEREVILQALREYRWNRTAVASKLGLTFRSIRYRIHALGIEENGAGARKLPAGFSQVWPKLREAAFKILGRKCAACGIEQKHGAIMHIDHIKPMSRYPELALDLSNLQVLCFQCNLKKGAKDNA